MVGGQEVLHLKQGAPVDGQRLLRSFRHVHHLFQDPERLVDPTPLWDDRPARKTRLRGQSRRPFLIPCVPRSLDRRGLKDLVGGRMGW